MMKIIQGGLALGVSIAAGVPLHASPPVTAESALSRYCEPLIAGSTSTQITRAAKADGFKSDQVGGQPILIQGELILSLSDAPRVCFVQAPTNMTFAQGIALVDAWAVRHSGAMKGVATKGPDGALVRLWTAPKHNKFLLVTEQTNSRGQKVLAFILAPLPAK